MRSAPCDEPRSCPRAKRSTSNTDLPLRASAHVVAAPAIPAPITTTSGIATVCSTARCARRSSAPDGVWRSDAHRSPAVAGLLGEAVDPLERRRHTIVAADGAGPGAETLVHLHLQRFEVGRVVSIEERREFDVDLRRPWSAHPPGSHRLVPVVRPLEFLVDLGEPPVDAQRVLGVPGALGPLATELEPDRSAVARRTRRRRPVPPVRVRPDTATQILYPPRGGVADLPAPLARSDRSRRGPRVLLRRELEAPVAPRDHDVE